MVIPIFSTVGTGNWDLNYKKENAIKFIILNEYIVKSILIHKDQMKRTVFNNAVLDKQTLLQLDKMY